MSYIKNVTNVNQTLHQNVTNVTKQSIASKEIPTIEFHTKYMKLFVNMLSIICVLLNAKFLSTSENFYFEVILVQDPVSCEVTNVTNCYMDIILDLEEEFNCQKPLYLDSNRKHHYQSKTCCSIVYTRSCTNWIVEVSTFLVTNVTLEWTSNVNFNQNPSNLTNPKMESYCILQLLRCRRRLTYDYYLSLIKNALFHCSQSNRIYVKRRRNVKLNIIEYRSDDVTKTNKQNKTKNKTKHTQKKHTHTF